MAGRNKERLEKLRLELSQTYGEDLKASGTPPYSTLQPLG